MLDDRRRSPSPEATRTAGEGRRRRGGKPGRHRHAGGRARPAAAGRREVRRRPGGPRRPATPSRWARLTGQAEDAGPAGARGGGGRQSRRRHRGSAGNRARVVRAGVRSGARRHASTPAASAGVVDVGEHPVEQRRGLPRSFDVPVHRSSSSPSRDVLAEAGEDAGAGAGGVDAPQRPRASRPTRSRGRRRGTSTWPGSSHASSAAGKSGATQMRSHSRGMAAVGGAATSTGRWAPVAGSSNAASTQAAGRCGRGRATALGARGSARSCWNAAISQGFCARARHSSSSARVSASRVRLLRVGGPGRDAGGGARRRPRSARTPRVRGDLGDRRVQPGAGLPSTLDSGAPSRPCRRRTAGVRSQPHGHREAVPLLPHPQGRHVHAGAPGELSDRERRSRRRVVALRHGRWHGVMVFLNTLLMDLLRTLEPSP